MDDAPGRHERLEMRLVDADDSSMSTDEKGDGATSAEPVNPPDHAVIWLTSPEAVAKHAALVREIDEDLARRRRGASAAS